MVQRVDATGRAELGLQGRNEDEEVEEFTFAKIRTLFMYVMSTQISARTSRTCDV